MKKILFVHNKLTKFVEIDLKILQERYPTTELYLTNMVVNPLKIFKLVYSHELVFCWFASWSSFLPVIYSKLLGKPSIVVIGGYDIANMPEIGYGHQRGGLKKYLSRIIILSATQLITNSYYSKQEAIKNASVKNSKLKVIYHGLEVTNSHNSTRIMKKPMVVTVGNVNTSNLLRKGLESFVKAAGFLRDVTFVLIGKKQDEAFEYLKSIATPNVIFTGFVTDRELKEYLTQAKVYVQPSLHEGFGLSVAEAMLAGCVPVVTKFGALPEVVGDTGIYLESNNPEEVATGIRTGLELNNQNSNKPKHRVVENFNLEKRKIQFYNLFDKLLASDLSPN